MSISERLRHIILSRTNNTVRAIKVKHARRFVGFDALVKIARRFGVVVVGVREEKDKHHDDVESAKRLLERRSGLLEIFMWYSGFRERTKTVVDGTNAVAYWRDRGEGLERLGSRFYPYPPPLQF